MFSFFESCGLCQKIPKKGNFAYQSFKRVPKVGGIYGNTNNVCKNVKKFGSADHSHDPNKFNNNLPKDSVPDDDSAFRDLLHGSQQNLVIKKILKSDYNDLIQEYKDKKQKFTDPDFPPVQTSLGNGKLNGVVEWKRITDIFPDAKFVADKINPSDIVQGKIGDCYFLCAIAALAENDFRIKNLFPNLEMNPWGIYMARILHRGVIQQVVVDDYIPCVKGLPAFAQPMDKEIWVMILQKCWAKLNKSYTNIEAGLPHEVLYAFSGAPTFYHNVPTEIEGQDVLWSLMWQAYSKGAVLCCGTTGDQKYYKYGFVPSHAYTILNLYQQPYKMVKMRNPWGKYEWKGRASDSDLLFWNKISEEDKQMMGYGVKDDGIFFMTWDSFVNFFAMVDICKINDNACYSNLQTQFDRENAEMFEFSTAGGKVMLTLSQQSLRGADPKVQSQGYAPLSIIIGQYNEGSQYEYKYINSSSTRYFADYTIELPDLKKGTYVAYIQLDWINNNPDTACVSIYAESPTNIVHAKQQDHVDFLSKVFLDHARNNINKTKIGNTNKDWLCNDLLLLECGYGYLVFHLDANSNCKLGVQINEKQYTDKKLTLEKPYRGSGIIKTFVESGKELIVLFRINAQTIPGAISLPYPKIYNLIPILLFC